MDHILFIHLSVGTHLNLSIFWTLFCCCYEYSCIHFFEGIGRSSILLDWYLAMKLLNHLVILFTVLRNCQTIFSSGWTILLSHQQCTRVPIASCPCQCLLLPFILIILMSVRGTHWVLICTFLMTYDFKLPLWLYRRLWVTEPRNELQRLSLMTSAEWTLPGNLF